MKGTLVTEFSADCQVTGQSYVNSKDVLLVLRSYLNEHTIEAIDVDRYSPVEMKARCSKCGNGQLARELDGIAPTKIVEAPVGPPIFVCSKCGHRHYSITNEYVRSVALANKHLFEKNELAELEKNEEVTVNELKEIIIRSFASKKISRVVLV